jgi:hypothetical protein
MLTSADILVMVGCTLGVLLPRLFHFSPTIIKASQGLILIGSITAIALLGGFLGHLLLNANFLQMTIRLILIPSVMHMLMLLLQLMETFQLVIAKQIRLEELVVKVHPLTPGEVKSLEIGHIDTSDQRQDIA